MIIIGLLIGILICCLIYFIIIHPKLLNRIEINKRTLIEQDALEKNIEIKKETVLQIEEQIESLQKNIVALEVQYGRITTEITEANIRKEDLLANVEDLKKVLEQSEETGIALMQEKLDQSAQKLSAQYIQEIDNYQREYLKTLQESTNSYNSLIREKKELLSSLEQQLKELKEKTDAAIENHRREEEKRIQLSKYRIILSETDLQEIECLRQVIPYFRNARPICKAIWESYYRDRCNEMINRVVGAGVHTGIYKLTNLDNNMTYVGQAVDISERFKEHCKAGLGIDTPNNKLYAAMQSIGIENFSFEVVEECSRADLNTKERYWIEYFKSQSFGYNMTKGNK